MPEIITQDYNNQKHFDTIFLSLSPFFFDTQHSQQLTKNNLRSSLRSFHQDPLRKGTYIPAWSTGSGIGGFVASEESASEEDEEEELAEAAETWEGIESAQASTKKQQKNMVGRKKEQRQTTF